MRNLSKISKPSLSTSALRSILMIWSLQMPKSTSLSLKKAPRNPFVLEIATVGAVERGLFIGTFIFKEDGLLKVGKGLERDAIVKTIVILRVKNSFFTAPK
uniref:Uncharacterized protein n=1 Tax=Strongyloides venezuelensis TaxID=75913 RepID=A0A0K0FZA7_STRVS